MSAAAETAAAAGTEQALSSEHGDAWKRDADRWLDEQPQGRLFTADILVEAIGKADAGRNPAIGGWFSTRAKQKRIEWTGRYSKSVRVEGHGNEQKLWRVKDQRDERVGGDAGSSEDGVSSSSLVRVGGGVDDIGPHRRGDVSSSPHLPPLTMSEEEEWEALRDPEFLADAPPRWAA